MIQKKHSPKKNLLTTIMYSLLWVSLLVLVWCGTTDDKLAQDQMQSYVIDYDVRYAESEDLLSTTVRETATTNNIYIEWVAYESVTIYTPLTEETESTDTTNLPFTVQQAAIKMWVWEEVSMKVTPEEAYADNYDERLLMRYPLSLFWDEKIAVWQERTIEQKEWVVLEVTESEVVFDTNPAYVRSDLLFTLYRRE